MFLELTCPFIYYFQAIKSKRQRYFATIFCRFKEEGRPALPASKCKNIMGPRIPWYTFGFQATLMGLDVSSRVTMRTLLVAVLFVCWEQRESEKGQKIAFVKKVEKASMGWG